MESIVWWINQKYSLTTQEIMRAALSVYKNMDYCKINLNFEKDIVRVIETSTVWELAVGTFMYID